VQSTRSSNVRYTPGRGPVNVNYEAFGAERLYSGEGEFHGGYGWKDLRELDARCGTHATDEQSNTQSSGR
jgi:hypothetical protein